MWKDFFYFTKADRRIILLLCTVLLVGLFASAYLHFQKDEAVPLAPQAKADVEAFLDSLKPRTYAPRTYADNRPYPSYGNENATPRQLFAFNPNTADSAAFLRLGLKPWQIKNIYKYRAKGGRYRTPDDFAKLYGLSEADFQRLKPYISIAEDAKKDFPQTDEKQAAPPVEKTALRYPEKFSELTKVDLNAADTTLLKKIPGIGSGLAAAIVGYRTRLGGFANLDQLKEVKNLPIGIEKWFETGHAKTAKLNLNKLSVEQLRRHPYLNFQQAKAIVEHRRQHGPLSSLKQLSLYDCFTPADFERLTPYVAF